MKISFLVVALVASISVHVAVVAKSSKFFTVLAILPGGIPPIKTNSVVVSPFYQPSSLA